LWLFVTTVALDSANAIAQSQKVNAMIAIILISVFDAIILTTIAIRSNLTGLWLMAMVGFSYYFVKTFQVTNEAWFFMKNMDHHLMAGMFMMTIPASVIHWCPGMFKLLI
jgi:hypothetical protein